MAKLSRLKTLRERRALTQHELAERAGVNRVTVARLEGGVDHPLPGTVRKLADALGVGPEDLMDVPKAGTIVARRGPALLPPRLAALMKLGQLEVRDPDDVIRVLGGDAGLADVIADAADQASRFFPDASFTLEVVYDPEYEDDGELFMGVKTSLPHRQAFEVLDRFDEKWWLSNVRRAHGLLGINLARE